MVNRMIRRFPLVRPVHCDSSSTFLKNAAGRSIHARPEAVRAKLHQAGSIGTGWELADGWLGTSFIPEHADAHLSYIRKGAEKAGRSLDDIDIGVGGNVHFGDDVEAMVESRRPYLAFTLGAMGSPRTNFYNTAFRRAGFEDACIEVQRLWVDGRREEAAKRVPEEMILRTNLLGTESMVRQRIRAYRDAGVDTLRVDPSGDDLSDRLDTLGRAIELVRQECPA